MREQHDALVMEIVGWLTCNPDATLPDPLERADQVIRTLSRQRRYEEAQNLLEACEHLLSIRRAYESLAEAHSLRFAALWPQAGNGADATVRLNLVWNGTLREPVSLHPHTLEEEIGAALDPLWDRSYSVSTDTVLPVAVLQNELDSLLAVRRWFAETDHQPKMVIPGPEVEEAKRQAFKTRLAADAYGVLSIKPPPVGRQGSVL